jgi:hypothetical protein
LVGIVVLRSISRVNTPPRVSMPSDSGVTSSSSTSLTSPLQHAALDRRADRHDLVGLTPLRGSLPKNSLTASCTFGMRVMPPTRITSSISPRLTAGVLERLRQGSMVFWIRSSTSASSLARVSFMSDASARRRRR